MDLRRHDPAPSESAQPTVAAQLASPPEASRSEGAPAAADPTIECEVLLLDPAGQPLGDVEVGLAALATDPRGTGSMGSGPLVTGQRPAFADLQPTDAHGVARFAVPAGDGREVAAWSALGGEVRATLRAGEAVRLTLRPTVRCWAEGMVVDAGGQGIADAELVLLPWQERGGPSLPCAQRVGRSGKDGSFRVGLAQGGRLGAVHDQFSPSPMELVQLEAGAGLPPKTLRLHFTLVTLQARAQGVVVDAAGAPIAGALLEFQAAPTDRHGAWPAPPQRTATGGDGRFAVRHLLPGDGTWAVRAAGFGATAGSFSVAPGATAELRIALAPAAAVEGVVQDAAGAPVGGVLVRSGPADAFASQSVRSNPDGTFHLDGLAAGPTTLLASERRTIGSVGRSATTRIDLRAGEVARWTAVLQAAAAGPALRGMVVDTDGRPLVGWRITAIDAEGAARTALTGAAGEFAVGMPDTAAAQVSVHAPDQPPTSFPSAHVASATPGSSPLRIVVDRATPWSAVRGLVQSASLQPVPASVSVWHHGLRRFARTQAGADGRFRIERVPAGRFDVYVDHPGHASLSQTDLEAATGAEIDLGVLTLEVGAALHGSVTGPDGRPPEHLELYLQTKDARLAAEYAGGTYRVGSVPPGRHVLQVQGSGVAAATFVVELQAGTEHQQDIRLLAGVPRRFEVVAPAAAGPFLSLALRSPGAAHQWLAGQPRRDSGTLKFTAYLAPGSYEAVAWGIEGWQAIERVTFAAGDDSVVRLEVRPK